MVDNQDYDIGGQYSDDDDGVDDDDGAGDGEGGTY